MSRIAFRPVIAGVALTLACSALAGTALAAASDAAPAAGHTMQDHHGHMDHRHWHGMRDAMWLPGVGPVGKQEVDQLRLDANQQTLFKAAQEAQRDLRKSMREAAGARHKALEAQLQAGKLDPHALSDQQGQSMQQLHAQAEQARQKWLAVWDGLNDGQRQQVALFLKDRQAKWEAHKQGGNMHGHKRPMLHTGPGPVVPPAN